MLQLRFVFVCYCYVILLHFLFYFLTLLIFSNSFVFWWRQNYVELWKLLKRLRLLWYVCIKYGNNNVSFLIRSSYVRKLRFNDAGFWFVIVRYFVLLNKYVTLGLQKHVFLIKSDKRHFFVHSGNVWKVRHNYVASWFVNLLYLFPRQNYVTNAFLTMTYFSWR